MKNDILFNFFRSHMIRELNYSEPCIACTLAVATQGEKTWRRSKIRTLKTCKPILKVQKF